MLRYIAIPVVVEAFLEHRYLHYARTCNPPVADEDHLRHVEIIAEPWVCPDRTSTTPGFNEGSRGACQRVCAQTGKPMRKRLSDRGCYVLWVEWYGTAEDPPIDTPVRFSLTGTIVFHRDGSRSVQVCFEGDIGGHDYRVAPPPTVPRA